MIKLICEQCGKEFYISPSRLNRLKCCSKKCSNLRKKKTQSGKNNPFYGKKHSLTTIAIIVKKNKNATMTIGLNSFIPFIISRSLRKEQE